jgi:hypothetical protein
MKCGAAAIVVAIALGMPVFGQHGGTHAGFAGHTGSAGHSGFVGHSGFSGGHTATSHFGGPTRSRFGGPGFTHPTPQMRPRFGLPYRGQSQQHRTPYRPGFGSRNHGWDRGHDRRRRGWYGGVYTYAYPAYAYPYPYVIDPGAYNWSDAGDFGDDQGVATNNFAPSSDYGYPQEPSPQDDGQPSYPAASASPQLYQPAPAWNGTRPPYSGNSTSSDAPASEEQLTLIFKDGRRPRPIRNYMMSTKELTDMDPQHFERIPLDVIDIDATVKVNRAHGVDFAVPSAAQDKASR